jgi:hypothetical protein
MMKLTQKKTCFGCKALNWNAGKPYCRLGYSTEPFTDHSITIPSAKLLLCKEAQPLEPCPKPTTQTDWNTAQTELRKGSTLGTWLKDKPITLILTHSNILLLERAMRTLRHTALEDFNEDKPLIPEADALIKRLQEAL